MTLVLSFACHGIAVQVADRLISELRGVRLRAFDEIANKLIIFRATDAIVSIGYAGQAYIGEIPTDEWIAEILTGQRFARGPGEFAGVRLGGVRVTDIGQAVRKLRDELPQHIAPGHLVQISVVGHQFDRRNFVRPIAYEMSARRDGISSFYQSPRRWPQGSGYLSAIGAHLTDDQILAILEPIRDANPSMPHDAIAAHLTDAIRRHEAPGIGPHTSAVILPFPGTAPARAKFLPMTPHHILLRTPRFERELEANYTPWAIGPGLIKPPTAEVGGSEYGLGGIPLQIEGSRPVGGGILSAMTTVPRRVLPAHFRR